MIKIGELVSVRCARCGKETPVSAEGVFTFMRHGQTAWNIQGLSVGSVNEPMNNAGRRQVREAANRMKENDVRFDAIVTSPLYRASEGADIVSDIMGGIPVEREELLRERCVGIQEGKPETPESDALWLRYDYTLAGAEPLLDFERKIRGFLSAAKSRWRGKRVLFMTHGFSLLTIIKFIKGLTTEEIMQFEPPHNADMTTFVLGDYCPDATCGSELFEK